MKKRILAAMLVLVLAFSTLNGFTPVNAEKADDTLTEEKMKEVLIIVKGKLDIGDEYTEFNYYYSENAGKGRYQFNWRTEDGSAYISVSADSTGRIYSFSSSNNEKAGQREGMIPTYIGEELIPEAEKWIVGVEPELQGKLKLNSCRYTSYNKNYVISFIRIENGIDMSDNSISVTMDAFDKSVLSYRVNWNFEVAIPKVDQVIGEEAAAEKVGGAVKMELKYRLTRDADGNDKVFLAYTPDKSYIAVDAKNGKVYTERTYWGSGTDFDEGFNDMEATKEAADAEESYSYGDRQVTLSDAEIKKLGDIKDILSSEEAINLIKNNKRLYVDGNLTSSNCRLYTDKDDNYYWRIYLYDDTPIDYNDYSSYYDYYRASLSASLDAKTGKLISFSADTKDYYAYSNEGEDVFKANYTKKQCQKLFEEFIKETDPDKAEYTRLSNVYDRTVTLYNIETNKDVYPVGGYSFTFGRQYKNIPFDANYVSGAVEAVTGKITSYNTYWTDAEIPEPENIIDESEAFASYIKCDGFDLVYELVMKYENKNNYYGYDKDYKARLVYRTAISPNYIDAFTGKQLTWSGEEYVPAGVSYKYTDINGTKYERSIKLLADMGYGFEGEEFKPDAKITNEEFMKILGANSYGGYRYYEDYEDEADNEDDDDIVNDDETTVIRQEAARLIISYLGGEKLAKMDIYKTGYSDESKIDKENLGSVALCKGLGIMGAKSGNKFKPNRAVTRGEAAEFVIRMLSANGI